MNSFELHGRSALVTGSTQGIGCGIAAALQAAGATVLLHGLKPADDVPAGAALLTCDLCDANAPAALLDQAFAAAPDLDILVCNAGSFFDVPFLEMTHERWAQTMNLNLRATYFLIQGFARVLVCEQRGGVVVITTSTNGLQPEDNSTAYDISKGALVMLTRTLALALAEHDIRVNAIAPGLIRTPLTARWLDSNTAQREHYVKNTPLGRIGLPEDCGGAVVFLCSPTAAFITGEIITIDGGLTLRQTGKQ